jgi:uncharacterized protein YjbI with pentapeptide repeats
MFIARSKRVGLLGVLISLLMNPVFAQEADREEQLRMLGKCRGCVFEGLDLSGRKLTGLDLTESTIRDVDFSNARLNIALFDNATLENVSFGSADLSGASFSGAHLINVSFDNADLKAAVFEDAILENTDLSAGLLCMTQMPNETTDRKECD